MSNISFGVLHSKVEQMVYSNTLLHEQHLATEEGEPIDLFNMSDKMITDLVYSTHVHTPKTFDEDSLFVIVKNILDHAIRTSDDVLQARSQVTPENKEAIIVIDPNLSIPLCNLKEIGSELSCKAPGAKIAHKTTLSILNKLSEYTWETKAVLTLTAFAMEIGEFWLLAQLYQSDQALASQLAILRRVPVLIKRPVELKKQQRAIKELNSMIRIIMDVIAIFDEFETLSKHYGFDIPKLENFFNIMPAYVYWTIMTIAACATKFSILISDEPEKRHDLRPYYQKIHSVLAAVERWRLECEKQKNELMAYYWIVKIFSTPTEIMEIFKAIIFFQIEDYTKYQPLIDGSKKEFVNLDVLKEKFVYLFISGVDVSDEDIFFLEQVHKELKKHTRYTMVWIPIVESWKDEEKKKFECQRSKMPWYILNFFKPIAGLKYIREHWEFTGEGLVVALNGGKLINRKKLDLIRGDPKFFEVDIPIIREFRWIDRLFGNLDASICTWLKGNKYIFFYGGKEEWTKQFKEKSEAIIKDHKINIELFCVEKKASESKDEGLSMLKKFWSNVESLLGSRTCVEVDQKAPEKDDYFGAKDIAKLLSFNYKDGWVLFSKGPTLVTIGYIPTMCTVLEQFGKWKENIQKNGFEKSLKDYYATLSGTTEPTCCHFYIPTHGGKNLEIQCPDPGCSRTLEMFTSYKCCHVGPPLNAFH